MYFDHFPILERILSVHPDFFPPIVKARRWWRRCPIATHSIAAFGYLWARYLT